jgi:hypothetical protein
MAKLSPNYIDIKSPLIGANPHHLKNFYNQITKNQAMLYGYQFILTFMGDEIKQFFGTDSTDFEKNLTYHAQSATIPAFTIDKAKIPFYGNTFRTPTVVKFDHNWKVELLLDQNMRIYEAARAWLRYYSDLKFSGGGNRVVPNVGIRINILDTYHQTFTTSYVIEGCWPTGVTDLKLEYKDNDTNIQKFTLNLKYQYCFEDPIFDAGTSDPLGKKHHSLVSEDGIPPIRNPRSQSIF